ncbi:MAG: TolC family protein [Mariniblastus sp.]
MIRRTAIIEAEATFDWTKFLETRWDDLNDPVGNTLTVGGTGRRYINQHWTAGAGLRRRNRVGGQLEAKQDLGHQRTNSNFFVPNPQGTARLVLGYTQPLLRGRGRIYNESLTCLAKLDVAIADDEFRRQLQSHLLEVTRAYWSLYLERGTLFQKMNSYQRAYAIHDILEKRRSVDAQQSQIISARASAATRYAELIRARMAVKNSESRLRSLVNDPSLGNFDETEIVPLDAPNMGPFEAEIGQAMEFAIQYRPEVLQALKQIKAGQLRLGMATHELLPQLDLITQAYVAGLDSDGQFGDAFTEQFNAGRPAYSIGLNYEIPIANRAANARNTRRRLEFRQLQSQYQTTLQTVKLEVEISVREIDTSNQEMAAKYQAMVARSAQLDALTKRWQRLPGEDVSASLALENLLVAQERLADAESDYLQSQLTYNLAQMNLKRSTGLLLRTEGVNIGTAIENDLPTHVLSKDLVSGPSSGLSEGGYQMSNTNYVAPQNVILNAPPTPTVSNAAIPNSPSNVQAASALVPVRPEFETSDEAASITNSPSEFLIAPPVMK